VAWTARGGGGTDGSRKPLPFSANELQRYGRHLILPEVAWTDSGGSRRRRCSCGRRSLGSPSPCTRGRRVGHLGLVDFDVVDFSNLQRSCCIRPRRRRKKLASAGPAPRPEPRDRDLAPRDGAHSENALDILRPTRSSPTGLTTTDALSRERRLRPPRQDQRVRLDLSLRGPGERVRRAARPLLPLLFPNRRARARAELRRGGVLGVLPGVIARSRRSRP